MTDTPSAYYARRAEAERALAEKAQDPAIARLHREMAHRYDEMLLALREPAEPGPA